MDGLLKLNPSQAPTAGLGVPTASLPSELRLLNTPFELIPGSMCALKLRIICVTWEQDGKLMSLQLSELCLCVTS